LFKFRGGWNGSWFYRILIIGGLVFLFSFPVIMVIVLRDSTGYALAPFMQWVWLPFLAIWLLAVLGYQWLDLVILPPDATEKSEPDDPPDLSVLSSLSLLAQSMSDYGGDANALAESARVQRRSRAEYMGWATLLAMLPVCAAFAGVTISFGRGEPPRAGLLAPFVVGYIVLAIIALVRNIRGAGRSMAATLDFYAPLGLAWSEEAETAVVGKRHGRDVRIEFGAKKSITILSGSYPGFAIASRDGKLEPDSTAPPEAADALKGLRKAKRWAGISVRAGMDGIRIERRTASSTGNPWLYDLWLAERLAHYLGS
jgi:hypothetical protein